MNKLLNRASLKKLFSNGTRPDETSFSNMIDSMLNVVDDGITKNEKDGLVLSPEGQEEDPVISFYRSIQQDQANWTIDLGPEENKGIRLVQANDPQQKESRVFLKENGGIGVNTEKPLSDLQVNGVFGTNARIGTFQIGKSPANGSWQQIISGLDGCQAFEIVAQVGKKHSGKYALVKATVICTFGKSKIRSTQAHYGFCWNKITFRVRGSIHDYGVEMKTRSNYGEGMYIRYHVSKLWDTQIESLLIADE
ncbi:MAG: hypothetical protein EP338_08945 [Bacteroidetes bacterium]|nr:MAG: hypothetical protein EP338_08945 [Bacteroidota bacterium]